MFNRSVIRLATDREKGKGTVRLQQECESRGSKKHISVRMNTE
jgi:hypothetical protein